MLRPCFTRFLIGITSLFSLGVMVEARPTSAVQAQSDVCPDSVSQIAFASNRDGNLEIYLMNDDGSHVQRLTSNPAADVATSWSPDGQKLLFHSNRGGNWDVYSMNADGTLPRALTTSDVNEYQASWSPDGQTVAYFAEREHLGDIYLLPADGSGNPHRVTSFQGFDSWPSWSPDGRQLAFTSQRDGDLEINVMKADGSDVRQLTDNTTNDSTPYWSPDGRHILFWSNRDGNQEIYVMNADGSDPHNLSNNPAVDVPTGWSPDGSEIVFLSDRDGNQEIYVMKADGSDVRRLTDNPAADTLGIWRPCPGSKPIAPVVVFPVCTISVYQVVNLRDGPGSDYAKVGRLNPNDTAEAVGTAVDKQRFFWLKLSTGGWVRSDVVKTPETCDSLPVISAP